MGPPPQRELGIVQHKAAHFVLNLDSDPLSKCERHVGLPCSLQDRRKTALLTLLFINP